MKPINKKINDLKQPEQNTQIILDGLTFTKNFRSSTSEEWYVFLKTSSEPSASATVIIHYQLQGNRDVFIQTTIIIQDPTLHEQKSYPILYAITDELINRLVGYADTLLTVYAEENSFNAEYIR